MKDFLRRWLGIVLGLGLGLGVGWWVALPGFLSAFILSLFWLVFLKWMSVKALAQIEGKSIYLDRYWGASEMDALRRHAFYWLYPYHAPVLAQVCRWLAGLCLGTAGASFLRLGNWVLPAILAGCAAFLLKQARDLNPLAHYSALAAKKHFEVSEEWGAILEIKKAFENQS